MSDHKEHSEESHHSRKKTKAVTIKLNRKTFTVAAGVVVLVGVFILGTVYGMNRQEKADNKKNPFSSRTTPATNSNRWTSVGTITEVSDSKIKVKDSRDQEKEATITKDTQIVNRKGDKLAAKDLKKDQKVIVSGEKDAKDDKKLTVTRIRLQD